MHDRTFPVFSQFNSIQGEGPSSGHLASFVRLAGCELHCDFCDTKDAWSVSSCLAWVEAQGIAQTVKHKLVVITGGEPLLYDLTTLLDAIFEHDHTTRVEIETSGAFTPKFVLSKSHERVRLIVSPKAAASYAVHYNIPEWAICAMKYLATPDVDAHFIAEHALRYAPRAQVFLQPLWDDSESLLHALGMLRHDERWRLSLQLHKMIGVQ